METRSYWSLTFFALLCLAAGTLVYLTGRPPDSAYLLPQAWKGVVAWQWLDGAMGQSLPSFLHALAFSVLTALCLQPWRYAVPAACTFWFVVNSAFEIGQADAIAPAIAARLPAFFADWPLLDHVGAYFIYGRMDPMDLVFTAAGCGVAWLLLRRSALCQIVSS